MSCALVHDASKLDEQAWSLLVYVGIMPGRNDAGDRDEREDLELRNCSCGATISRPRNGR